LTPFGADVIRACNRLGIVCDVATEDTVKQAVKVSSKPLLLSHTALQGSKAQGPTSLGPRQISRDHARAVAKPGAPSASGISSQASSVTSDGLKEMADVVGADHVSIGTDQQVAAGSLQDYADFAHLVGAMLSGGFTPADTGKVIGGNFLRIFAGSAG
jgi:membrane dipeptidase